MGKMIDSRPQSNKGEAVVWDTIKDKTPNDIICYHNRPVKGREFDFCLVIKNQGIVIIEVKGWQAEQITVKGIDEIVVDGFKSAQKSPLKQANGYRFALIDLLKDKFNKAPLVLGIVCYPFLSKKNYYDLRLDIISEESYTIFKDDLDSKDGLINKIYNLLSSEQVIPHASLDESFFFDIRNIFEVDVHKDNLKEQFFYSFLRILPENTDDQFVNEIISTYQNGSKQIIFVETESAYRRIIHELNRLFNRINVQPFPNHLEICSTGVELLQDQTNEYKTFNFELYRIDSLSKIINKNINIVEGKCTDHDVEVLKQLGKKSHFNLQQYLLEHADVQKNIMVQAGAGTGKTYSMVSRIAYLCNRGEDAITDFKDEIAMVTFTNDAANQMKSRIKKMFINYFILTSNPKFLSYIEDIESSHISTIHKFVIEILRELSFQTGLGYNFSIMKDTYLEKQIFDRYLSDFISKKEEENNNYISSLPLPAYEFRDNIIELMKSLLNKSIDFTSLNVQQLGQSIGDIPDMNEIFEDVIFPAEKEYFNEINNRNGMDLNECIICLNKLLNIFPEYKIANSSIKYLFIDEFQDTDDAQIDLFKKLQKIIGENVKLFIVGDLKQSIYRFRGAEMSAFKQIIGNNESEWAYYYLNINYRSDRRLLQIYNHIFTKMSIEGELPYEDHDILKSNIIKEEENNVFECIKVHGKDYDMFYDKLFKTIDLRQKFLSELSNLSNDEKIIAILVRTNKQVNEIVSEGKKHSIYVHVASGGDLYELPSTIDFFKLIMALTHSESSVHLMNFIQSSYINVNADFMKLHGMNEQDTLLTLKKLLDEYFMNKIGKTWQNVIDEINTQPILFVLNQIVDGLKPWVNYSSNIYRQKSYVENYELLIEKIINRSNANVITLNSIEKFLKINILTNQKELSRSEESNDGIKILCTTIHKAKGLEYGTVILPFTSTSIDDSNSIKLEVNFTKNQLSYYIRFNKNIEEKNSNFDDDFEIKEQEAEECRILYVALTRAMRKCIWFKNIDNISTEKNWASFMEDKDGN